MNFDWSKAKTFMTVAEEGSMTAAAKKLGMTQPTIGRQISLLEQELNIVLVERDGKGLFITPSGQELLEQIRVMAKSAEQISLIASSKADRLEGHVTITASEAAAAFLLPPLIAELRQVYPALELTVKATNDVQDLIHREADIAIRNSEPSEQDLIARRLRDDEGFLYASHDYVARHGDPKSLEDLANHEFLNFNSDYWFMHGIKAYGVHLEKDNFFVHCAHHLVQWEFVKAGIGIGSISRDIGDNEPKVQRVCAAMPPIQFPIWLVSHRELLKSRKFRVVYDFLAEKLM